MIKEQKDALIDFARNNPRKYTATQLGQMFTISASTVYCMAVTHRLQLLDPLHKEDNIRVRNIVKENYKSMTVPQMAVAAGTSDARIRWAARHEGVELIRIRREYRERSY